MSNTPPQTQVLQEHRLEAYFHRALHDAARHRHLDAGAATLHYLTHLLTDFARSERLFDYTENGLQIRPLALLYGEAINARSVRERRLWLQRLGDMSLFVSGLFAGRLSRRYTDLDYCVAMGGNAYGYLRETGADNSRDRAQAEIFGELSQRFVRFVDLLAEVGGGDPSPQTATASASLGPTYRTPPVLN
jgi:hypothetical protein